MLKVCNRFSEIGMGGEKDLDVRWSSKQKYGDSELEIANEIG